MPASLVQFKKADGVGIATVTLTSPVSTGSFIVVTGTYDPTGTISVTNDKSDTFTNSSLGNVVNADGIGNFVGAFLTPTTGAQTFTLGVNLATFTVLGVWEFTGLSSPTFDKAVQAYTNGSPPTPSSGSTGTLSSATEVAVGYGQASNTFTAAGSGWTPDLVDNTDTGSLWEHQFTSATTAIAATGSLTGASCSLFCVTFMSGSAPPPATTIGWSRAVDADRRGLIALQSDARQAFVPRFTTAKTPTGIVWPTGADKERLPPTSRQPDERYFTPRVLQAVNTNAGIPWVRSADEARIILRPDQYVVTWSPPQPPITTFFASSNADDYNPLAVLRRGDHAPGWTPKVPGGQVSTISGMAWNTSKEEMRPPKPPLNPDEFKPWFVRSPNPVPITWLPLTGKDVERLSPIDRLSDRYVVTWPPNVPPPRVAISGIAWHTSKEEMRPPRPPLNPDEARDWFSRSPGLVPLTWLPTAGEAEHFRTMPYEDRRVSFTLKPPPPPVGISGMAWFVAAEQIPRQYPGNTNQGWSTVWNPFIPPASPVVKVTVQYHPFFANVGQLRGF